MKSFACDSGYSKNRCLPVVWPFFLFTGVLIMLTAAASRADMLDAWHWRNPAPFADTIQSICFGNGKFVAVGRGGVVHTSTDGNLWDEGQRPALSTLNEVIYGGGQFIAVGNRGVILTSTNGGDWTLQPSGTTDDFLAVSFGNGRYVVGGVTGRLAVSTNGTSWSLSTVGTNDLNWITFGNGVFVMPAPYDSGSAVLQVRVSNDGENWGFASIPANGTGLFPHLVFQCEFGNGTFVALIQDEYQSEGDFLWNPTYRFCASSDGTNWTQGAMGFGAYVNGNTGYRNRFLVFANGLFHQLENYYAYNYESSGGPTYITTTFDGTSASTTSAPYDSADSPGMAYGNGRYVLPASAGKVWTSTDATNWTANYGGIRTAIGQMISDSNQYLFVVASQPILVSSDGVNFSAAGNSPTNIFRAIAFDGTNYIAVGISGNIISGFTGEIYTSTNTTDWVRRTSNANKALVAICRGASRWVVVGANGVITTSPNTLAWTLRNSGTANNLNGVAYGNATYVAVGDGGTIVSSLDGSSWDVQFSGTSANLSRVRFFNGQFFAVGASGTLLTSSDGSDWASVNTGTSEGLYDIGYGNGRYLAYGYGATNTLLFSSNGTVWQDITTKLPTSVAKQSIVYLDQSFWITGDNGLLLQSDSADGIPRLTGSALTNGGGFRIQIPINVPATYRIQATTNLAADLWRDVVTNSAPVAVWTDTNLVASPMQFYRIVAP